jgi:hypothetical protein
MEMHWFFPWHNPYFGMEEQLVLHLFGHQHDWIHIQPEQKNKIKMKKLLAKYICLKNLALTLRMIQFRGR